MHECLSLLRIAVLCFQRPARTPNARAMRLLLGGETRRPLLLRGCPLPPNAKSGRATAHTGRFIFRVRRVSKRPWLLDTIQTARVRATQNSAGRSESPHLTKRGLFQNRTRFFRNLRKKYVRRDRSSRSTGREASASPGTWDGLPSPSATRTDDL